MSKDKPAYLDLEKKIKNLEKLRAKLLAERNRKSRFIDGLRAAVNMPELYLDRNWHIVGYSDNFLSFTPKVAEFTDQKKSLREFLEKDSFEKIRQYQKITRALEKLPYGEGARWRLRYKGPNAADRIGKSWISHARCRKNKWRIVNESGKLKFIHKPHIKDEIDCYLMTAEEYGGPDQDLMVVYKVRTSRKKENIRDLSLVISGGSARDKILPDRVGYTVCTGSNYNSEARIQRQTSDYLSIPEVLETDTEYEITVERTGGKITRLLKNLRTKHQAPPLAITDSNAIYDFKNHVGFTTYSGEAEIYDLRIYTRRSRFGLEQFRIPFEVEVGLRDGLPDGRIFKLRLGVDESGGRTLNILMFEDITERKRAEAELRHLFEMQSLIICISTDFISLSLDELDNGINRALKALGEFAGVDLCYVRQLSEDGQTISSTHEWCADRIKSLIQSFQNIPVDKFPYLDKRLERFESVHINCLDDLPEEASKDKQILRKMGILSSLLVPMISGGATVGLLGFDCVTSEKTWSKENISLLVTVSDIFMNALARKKAEEALQDSEERFRDIAELSPFPISIIDPSGKYLYLNKKFTQVFGYTLEDTPTGRDWFRLAFPDPKQRAQAVSVWKEDLIRMGRGVHRIRTFSIACKDGSIKEVLFRSVTIKDEKQYITYEDITGKPR